MSQRELERRSGAPQALICRVEAGKEALLSTYERLADALGASLVAGLRPRRTDEEIVGELVDARLEAEDRRRLARQARPRRFRRQPGFLDLAFDGSAR